MKSSPPELTVEVKDAPTREDARMLQNRAASSLDGVKVESTDRSILSEVEIVTDVRCTSSMLRPGTRKPLCNASKYLRFRDPAMSEVGSVSGERELVCFVRDNDVRFDIQYFEKRFGVFRRSHSTEEFEGPDTGLASVSPVLDRHAG